MPCNLGKRLIYNIKQFSKECQKKRSLLENYADITLHYI